MRPMAELVPDPSPDLPDGSVQVLVVDRHTVSRIGLAFVLRRQPWVARCLLAASLDESVGMVERHKPDVAIVDVSDAGPFVSSLLAPLRGAHPAIVLLLSVRCPPTAPVAPPGLGVAGILTPKQSAEQIVASVRQALVDDHVPAWGVESSANELSERERQVLLLLSTGATNREIATTMNVGTETVKKHAASLYRKLGVRNRTEAAQRAQVARVGNS
jgi:DNA-binding NarL/FixJ family response regulator